MSEKLSCPVMKIDDCIGDEVSKAVASMPSGSICLLENTRFYKEEEKNEASFAKKLAGSATIFVNDAFGTAHRAHASTEGVTKYCKTNVAGFLLQKELDYLDGAVSNPERPFCAIVGGSKVSSKIGVIESLLQKTDKIILGGGMIFTFYKALGKSVGASLVEDDKIDLAKELMAKAEAKGVKLLLPTDVVVADKFAADANTQVVSVDNIPEGWMGLDVGPDSVKSFQAELNECKSVIWNGPMGVFEMASFETGIAPPSSSHAPASAAAVRAETAMRTLRLTRRAASTMPRVQLAFFMRACLFRARFSLSTHESVLHLFFADWVAGLALARSFLLCFLALARPRSLSLSLAPLFERAGTKSMMDTMVEATSKVYLYICISRSIYLDIFIPQHTCHHSH